MVAAGTAGAHVLSGGSSGAQVRRLLRERVRSGATCKCIAAVEYTWTSSADCFSRSGGGFSSFCSLFQFLEVFDCKGLMSHVPRSAAFGLDQTCFKMFRNSSYWIFDCKGLMSHVPHSAAFGLDQMCYAAGGSRRAPRPKAGVAPRPRADTCRLCVFLYCSGERRVVFVVKASAAARESQLWLAVAIAIAVQASRQSKWKDRAHWFPPRADIVAFVVSSVWLFDCMRILCLARSSSSPASLADSA